MIEDYYKFLKETYKSGITPGKKNVEEIECYLKESFGAQDYALSKMESSYLVIEKTNAFHAQDAFNAQGDEKKFSIEEMELAAFYIPLNEETAVYYEELARMGIDGEEEPLVVLLEKRTGYTTSRSNKLAVRVWIDVGITQEDYDNETLAFYDYCMKLDGHEHSFMF